LPTPRNPHGTSPKKRNSNSKNSYGGTKKKPGLKKLPSSSTKRTTGTKRKVGSKSVSAPAKVPRKKTTSSKKKKRVVTEEGGGLCPKHGVPLKPIIFSYFCPECEKEKMARKKAPARVKDAVKKVVNSKTEDKETTNTVKERLKTATLEPPPVKKKNQASVAGNWEAEVIKLLDAGKTAQAWNKVFDRLTRQAKKGPC
jgi:hypothetical protein